MSPDLSKKEKKLARQLIEKGLQQEFQNGLNQFAAIIQQWKEENLPHRETYHKLYITLTDYDKHIARRYDGMTGSRYIYSSWLLS